MNKNRTMKTAKEILNEVIPNRGMNNDELTIKAMEAYASQFTSPIDTDKIRQEFYNKCEYFYKTNSIEMPAENTFNWFIANYKPQDKPLLGLAKTSELIYELSARCDTGSIDKGGDYRTVDY